MEKLQLTDNFSEWDKLHQRYGSFNYAPVYGAGKIRNPKFCLIFMNPTAKNVSASPKWEGLRAPWLGTKRVWKLLNNLGLFKNVKLLEATQSMPPDSWSVEFCEKLYSEIAKESVYITNIAKCTQDDARPLPNTLFKEYLPSMISEIERIAPKHVISFGNQVSSILLNKQISVSKYISNEHEILKTLKDNEFKVYPTYYPTYYPVGQGSRNMPKAIERIRAIVDKSP